MKKNKIILLTILIMLVIYCGAVVFVTKPDGFELSSLFSNTNATLSEESKTQLKGEIEEDLKTNFKAELAESIKQELYSQLSTELSDELSAKISAEIDSKIEALINQKLTEVATSLEELVNDEAFIEEVLDKASMAKEVYDAIREQIRTEKINEVLSQLN